MTQETKKTVLFDEHKHLGAKMFSFAGWEMPLQYSSVKDEHFTVRNQAGLFDVSHMGQVFVTGQDAPGYLQSLVPKDIAGLSEGKAVYTMLVNENGGIIDDLIIYRLPDEDGSYKFLLIINASRIQEDIDRLLSTKNGYDVKVINKSDEFSMIALQGPASVDITDLAGLKKQDQPKRFNLKQFNIFGMDILVARTGYTGEDGFEIIVKNLGAVSLWRELLIKGGAFGLKPIGYAARDTLRLEASLPLYGKDLDEKTTPVEAALCRAVSKDKKDDYAGKEIILEQITTKNLEKKLVGFKMLDKSVPRHDYEIYIENQNAGIVTSGGFSPCANIGIGLGYIHNQNSKILNSFQEGTKIEIMIRGKLHPAQIVKTPFIAGSKRKGHP